METDGFQADTEDEDDDDCIILCEQSGKCGHTYLTRSPELKGNIYL